MSYSALFFLTFMFNINAKKWTTAVCHLVSNKSALALVMQV